jgi:hypothetical protein
MRNISAVAATCLLATSAAASNIGAARLHPVDQTFESEKTIFELERCLIDVDAQGMPLVYRQPDKPGKTLIAYSSGIGVPILVELTTSPTGTRMDIRSQRLGLRKSPIAGGFAGCV